MNGVNEEKERRRNEMERVKDRRKVIRVGWSVGGGGVRKKKQSRRGRRKKKKEEKEKKKSVRELKKAEGGKKDR